MKIGGLLKNSMIDFPGKISAVVFTMGCNFQCPYCHNPDLISASGEPRTDTDSVLEFLRKRTGFLDAVVVTGGEPTLQEGLSDFLSAVKALGYPVKLDTNGSRPQTLENILRQGLADFVAMDLKTLPEHYPALVKAGCRPEDVARSMELLMGSGLAYEFRTTVAEPMVNDAVILEMAGRIQGARRWAFQPCVEGHALDPDFLKNAKKVYSKADLERFASLARPFVSECVVRA